LPVRLLAVDLDGTIVGPELSISPRVRSALRRAREAGVHVTLASGRPFQGMQLFAQDLGINEPLICYQGALVQDPVHGEVYLHRGVPVHLAQEYIGFVRERGWELCLFLDSQLYAERVTPGLRLYAEYSPLEVEVHRTDNLQAILSGQPTKLVVIVEAEQGERVSGLLQARFESRLRIVRSHACFVEATHPSASKGQALAFLTQRLGVPQRETMAIGDNDNDADMVAWAGLGVAMGNASAAVKSAADYVTAQLSEDGAAEAIERFVLGQDDG
jgi:Cof subfamily protein (haloacid dehalogenase superfamily)